MAKTSVAGAERPNPFVRTREFFQEVNVEMKKVAWPSRDELKQSTQVVLVLLGIVGGIIFVYDGVFRLLIISILGLFR